MDVKKSLLILLVCGNAWGAGCRAQPATLPPSRGKLENRPLQAITPAADFFVVQFSETPRINATDWRLKIEGMVSHPLTLSLAELNRMPQHEEVVTIECVENSPGGGLIATGRWGGVLLVDLLRRAGVKGEPRTLVFRAADGYMESIPYAYLRRAPVLVTTRLNGAPLPVIQGAPARLIIPGLYGMKQLKWVQSISLIAGEAPGYWQQRGWTATGVAAVKSWIYRLDPDPRRPLDRLVRGVAYAGLNPVARVEISLDGGRSWRQAQIDRRVGPYAWVLWSYSWRNPAPGNYTLTVRAVDANGAGQPVVDQEPRDGNNGIQAVTVRISK